MDRESQAEGICSKLSSTATKAEEDAFTWPFPYMQKILLILKNKNRVTKQQLSSNSLYNQVVLNGIGQHGLGRKTPSISHLLSYCCVHIAQS